ncbi:ammonium transporter [Viridibacterium curvum]|uniref:Ammonium transporter n=1 Tax=Viridibacterium curvum TaxID=1101404 RepID=A0ABP9R4L6_9RHOO
MSPARSSTKRFITAFLFLIAFQFSSALAAEVNSRIGFNAGSADLTPAALDALKRIVATQVWSEGGNLTLTTSPDADEKPESGLSTQRNTNVIEALRMAGITPARIVLVSAPASDASGSINLEISTADASPAAPAVAAPAPGTAAPVAPFTTTSDKLNSGDTAWMMTSMALVLLMTIPGLALFYAGMVRKKNALATMMQSLVITALVTLLWWLCAYSLAFTPGSSMIGGMSRALFEGMLFKKSSGELSVSHLATTIPESVYAMYQLTFAIITPALICGAFAERIKFSALICFMCLWSLLVYAPIAHWVWEPGGWLAAMGALDFAGGTVVHVNAGAAALACAIVIGPRVGYGQRSMAPHNLTLTLTGAALLWVGWFGFNAGSAVAADGRAGMAMLTTQLATASAALAWSIVEWGFRGKTSALGIASGAVAGLVAITPASGFVDSGASVIIGAAGGVACYLASTLGKRLTGLDDSLDAFGVHCTGGVVGALLTGVFASQTIGGVTGDLATQAIAVGATLVYSFVVSFIILKLLQFTIGLRVSADQEEEGLDISLHGEQIQ